MSRADQDGDAHVPGRVDHVAPLVDRGGDVQIFYKHFSLSPSVSLIKVQGFVVFSYRNNTYKLSSLSLLISITSLTCGDCSSNFSVYMYMYV